MLAIIAVSDIIETLRNVSIFFMHATPNCGLLYERQKYRRARRFADSSGRQFFAIRFSCRRMDRRIRLRRRLDRLRRGRHVRLLDCPSAGWRGLDLLLHPRPAGKSDSATVANVSCHGFTWISGARRSKSDREHFRRLHHSLRHCRSTPWRRFSLDARRRNFRRRLGRFSVRAIFRPVRLAFSRPIWLRLRKDGFAANRASD